VSDIDECEMNPCDQLCTNSLGSYSCSCYDGYQLVNDTRCIAEGMQLMRNRYGMLVFSYLCRPALERLGEKSVCSLRRLFSPSIVYARRTFTFPGNSPSQRLGDLGERCKLLQLGSRAKPRRLGDLKLFYRLTKQLLM